MSVALRTRGLKPSERLVYVYLCDRANGELVCWPNAATIADDLELSRRAVLGAIPALEAKGLIRTENRYKKSSVYHILRGKRHTDTQPLNGANPAPHRHANPAPQNWDENPAPQTADDKQNTAEYGHLLDANSACKEPILTDFSHAKHDASDMQNLHPESSIKKEPKEDKGVRALRLAEETQASKVRQAVAVWNDICGERLGCVKKVTPARQAALSRLLKGDFEDKPENWVGYCRRVAASPFLTNADGTNRSGWHANLDFVLQERNLVRIIEGNFDGRPPRPKAPGRSTGGSIF